MKQQRRTHHSAQVMIILSLALLIGACNVPVQSQLPQPQESVATWNDIEIQAVTLAQAPGMTLKIDLIVVGRAVPPTVYPLFFHVTDPSGELIAQLDIYDVKVDAAAVGTASARHYEMHLPAVPAASANRLRVIMGRYDPDSLARIATVDGRKEIEAGVVDWQ